MTEGNEPLVQSNTNASKNIAEFNNNSLPLRLEEANSVEKVTEPNSPTSGGLSPRTREMLAEMEALNRSVNAHKQGERDVFVLN